jgi:hypothetical protein
MPDRDAVTCHLGDGFDLVAAGLRREKDGGLSADLMLQNGRVLFADRAVLNTVEGRQAWAQAAQTPDGPSAERLEEALREYLLPDALAILQEAPKKPTQADLLVGMVTEQLGDFAADVAASVELFHDAAGHAYVTIPIGNHRETWSLSAKSVRQWLARRYHEAYGKIPGSQALTDALGVLAGKALFDGPLHHVHLRLAEHEGVIYLDLCNERWELVAIDRSGWRVVATPPVKFRRTRGMLPLPVPRPGGTLEALRPFLNLPLEPAPWILVVSWLIAAFRPRGPYPVLVVLGEQGSAKSTLQRVLRSLLDPNKAPIRSLPRDERDLMITATNGWCLAFDNLSHLQDWQSDAMCRISTGGGFAVRELYSDLDETILDVQRPQMLNGIEEVVTRNDLLDRAVMTTLPSIPRERRRPEKHLWRDFEQARPVILGAILDAVSTALANEGTVTLDGHPRMADFAEWIVAAEPALPWAPEAFLTAYAGNQDDANDLTLEASPVAQAVRELMREQTEPWTSTATELLTALEELTDEKTRRQKSWPGSGRAMANDLRRLAPNLRVVGIAVTFSRAGGGRRLIQIEKLEKEGDPSSPSSPGASLDGNAGDDEPAGDDAHRHRDDGNRHQDAPSSQAWEQDSVNWWEESAGGDDGDDGDDAMHKYSDLGEAPPAGRVCVQCGVGLPDGWVGFYCAPHGRQGDGEAGDDGWTR